MKQLCITLEDNPHGIGTADRMIDRLYDDVLKRLEINERYPVYNISIRDVDETCMPVDEQHVKMSAIPTEDFKLVEDEEKSFIKKLELVRDVLTLVKETGITRSRTKFNGDSDLDLQAMLNEAASNGILNGGQEEKEVRIPISEQAMAIGIEVREDSIYESMADVMQFYRRGIDEIIENLTRKYKGVPPADVMRDRLYELMREDVYELKITTGDEAMKTFKEAKAANASKTEEHTIVVDLS